MLLDWVDLSLACAVSGMEEGRMERVVWADLDVRLSGVDRKDMEDEGEAPSFFVLEAVRL